MAVPPGNPRCAVHRRTGVRLPLAACPTPAEPARCVHPWLDATGSGREALPVDVPLDLEDFVLRKPLPHDSAALVRTCIQVMRHQCPARLRTRSDRMQPPRPRIVENATHPNAPHMPTLSAIYR